MTCIEFFDNNVIENIFTCLAVKPDKVILIGENGRTLDIHIKRYKEFTDSKGLNITFKKRTVPRNDIDAITNTLCEIIDEGDDCTIDITGGDYMYIAAAGMINERYSDSRIQIHRINFLNSKAYDVDGDKKVLAENDMPKLKVRDCVRLFGGKVTKTAQSDYDIDDAAAADIDALWDICRADPTTWNRQIGILAAAEAETDETDPLTTSVSVDFIENRLRAADTEYKCFSAIIDKLTKAKLVRYRYADGVFIIKYKNPIIKECLTVSGRALELQIYRAAQKTGKDGALFYNDVEKNVLIDWDGEDNSEKKEAVNEVDVVMMRGVVPVFVSCKNGNFRTEELYKLSAIAMQFGGKYAKKVLAVANPIDIEKEAHILERAKEMNIKIMDNLCESDSKSILKKLCQFWS